MRKLLLLSALLSAFCITAKAQSYEVPVNYSFHNSQDYVKYQDAVVSTVDWLQQTHWTDEPEKRRLATAFLFKWIQGTPDITMELMPTLMNLTNKNNQLLATFIGAYTKYAIQHPKYDRDDANFAAVKALLEKYKAEPTHVKDNYVESLIKIDKDGGLRQWVIDEYERSST